MAMSCGRSACGRFTKKRIIVLSSLSAGIATASYLAFTTLDSRALVAFSALLGIAACPLICAAVGGVFWVRNKMSRNKSKRMKINMKSYRSLAVSQRLKKNKGKDTNQSYT